MNRLIVRSIVMALALVGLLAFVAAPVANAAMITYNFNDGLQGWTQIYPTPPTTGEDNLWQYWDWGENSPPMYPGVDVGGHLGGGNWNDGETAFGRSPAFTLDASRPITFNLIGCETMIAAPAAPSAIPVLAIENGGFMGVALRDVATDTYVLWKNRTGSEFIWQANSFSAAELVPYVIDGKQYTLDFIDYNKGGETGWVGLGYLTINAPEPSTLILLGLGGLGLLRRRKRSK